MTPSQAAELIARMSGDGLAWVRNQRAHYRPLARALSDVERARLSPYFAPPILDVARIAVVREITNPAFYTSLPSETRSSLLDFTEMDAITFVDIFLVRSDIDQAGDAWLALVFHELVHVAQYAQLGVQGFVDTYLQGWADNDLEYARIPLEVMAYDLQARFERGIPAFDAEAEVRKMLGSVGRPGGTGSAT